MPIPSFFCHPARLQVRTALSSAASAKGIKAYSHKRWHIFADLVFDLSRKKSLGACSRPSLTETPFLPAPQLCGPFLWELPRSLDKPILPLWAQLFLFYVELASWKQLSCQMDQDNAQGGNACMGVTIFFWNTLFQNFVAATQTNQSETALDVAPSWAKQVLVPKYLNFSDTDKRKLQCCNVQWCTQTYNRSKN